MGQRCTHASRGAWQKKHVLCPSQRATFRHAPFLFFCFFFMVDYRFFLSHVTIRPSPSSLRLRPTLTHLTQHNHKRVCMCVWHLCAQCPLCSKPLLCVAVTRGSASIIAATVGGGLLLGLQLVLAARRCTN